MKRKQLIVLTACISFCIIVLVTLYAFSPLSKEIYRASFNRTFLPKSVLTEKAVMDLEYNSFYLAGYADNKIYLGNSTSPFHLLIADKTLTDAQHITLKVKLDSIMAPNQFRLTVDSPYFFLTHGAMPELLRGKINEWEASRFLDNNPDYFAEAIPLSHTSFALRSYSVASKGYELAKKSTTAPFRFKHDLLQKQIDGLFCLDGHLHYSKELNQLIYLHFYRNEFIVADSNLNLIYRGHTIDTFRRARIKIARIGSESMLSAPPMQINGKSSVWKKYLFVQSNLLAQNEDMENFLQNTIIDIYDLTTGKYQSSLYVPHYKNKQPLDFQIVDNHIVVINDHYLILYALDPAAQAENHIEKHTQ